MAEVPVLPYHWRIDFEGIPPSANNMRKVVRGRGGKGIRQARTAVYEDWLNANVGPISRMIPGPFPAPKVGIMIVVVGGTDWHGGRDTDNVIKPAQDCIQKAGAIPTDNHKVVRFSSSLFVKGKGGGGGSCFVVLVPWDDGDMIQSLYNLGMCAKGSIE